MPHSLSGSHLAAANYPSLCVLSLLLFMSLCMPVYVERDLVAPSRETQQLELRTFDLGSIIHEVGCSNEEHTRQVQQKECVHR